MASPPSSPTLRHHADRLGVRLALQLEHAVGQQFGRVTDQHRTSALQDHAPGVVRLVGEVDGAARLPLAVRDDGFVHTPPVHALAAELGQQRRVDVQHTAREVVRDLQQTQKPAEADQVDPVLTDDAEHVVREAGEVVVVLASYDVARQVQRVGALEAFRLVVRGDDDRDLGAQRSVVNLVGEVLHRGPAAADEASQSDGIAEREWRRRHVIVSTIPPMSPDREAEPQPGVTRLAPSPTGALHLGNARTFLINWAMAREAGWRVVMRVEDLDGPRVKPDAADGAIRDLAWLGLDWDGPPTYQSHALSPYEAAFHLLGRDGLLYRCSCSRKQIEQAASAPHGDEHELRYPGTCRPDEPEVIDCPLAGADLNGRVSVRLRVPDEPIAFHDELLSDQAFNVQQQVGDFIVVTKLGQPAYQLAVVVDDARQGVTEVVRGDDLLRSTARQVLLYRLLRLGRPPRYTHLPLVCGPDGRRLAKRHGDTRLAHYRERGVKPERVVGLLAHWSGITAAREPMNSKTFAQRFDPTALPREPVTMTEEDERWLLGND